MVPKEIIKAYVRWQVNVQLLNVMSSPKFTKFERRGVVMAETKTGHSFFKAMKKYNISDVPPNSDLIKLMWQLDKDEKIQAEISRLAAKKFSLYGLRYEDYD